MAEKHRQRLRDEYKAGGIEALSDVHALELLLFHAVPRKDMNPVAHELMKEFGSLKGVLDAPLSALTKVEGVGESTALLIKLVGDIRRKAEISAADRASICSTDDAKVFCRAHLEGLSAERFFVASLNSRNVVINSKFLEEGVVNSVNIDIRKLAEFALSSNAVSVIVAHNHPGGGCRPSEADIKLTKSVNNALSAIGINLLDHIIIASENSFSFRDSGLL